MYLTSYSYRQCIPTFGQPKTDRLLVMDRILDRMLDGILEAGYSGCWILWMLDTLDAGYSGRSEERRVGKECVP